MDKSCKRDVKFTENAACEKRKMTEPSLRHYIVSIMKASDTSSSTNIAGRRLAMLRSVVSDSLRDAAEQNAARNGVAFVCVDVNEATPRDVFTEGPLRRFDYYILSHVYAGEGRLFLSNSKVQQRLPAGSVVLLTPGTANLYGGVSADYREDYLGFCGPEIDDLCRNDLIRNGCVMLGTSRRLPAIADALRGSGPEAPFRAKLLLMELLLEIHARHLGQPRHRLLARLLEEIGRAPGRPWPLQEMADACHCSTAQLRRNMVEYTGMLPKAYVEGIRFQYAAEMLTLQELPIEEVARRLGYPDRFHFSRRFKAFFGVAPGQFRAGLPQRHA